MGKQRVTQGDDGDQQGVHRCRWTNVLRRAPHLLHMRLLPFKHGLVQPEQTRLVGHRLSHQLYIRNARKEWLLGLKFSRQPIQLSEHILNGRYGSIAAAHLRFSRCVLHVIRQGRKEGTVAEGVTVVALLVLPSFVRRIRIAA